MAGDQIDFFHAGFADGDGRGVRFLLGAELLSPLLQAPQLLARVARISRLPFVDGSVTLFPDASPKPFGFPAGIVMHTSPGWLYPLSAPDMGCGYLVVDTGVEIDPDGIDRRLITSCLAEIIDAVQLSSTRREATPFDVAKAMREGLAAVGAPSHFSTAEHPAEETNSWEPATSALDPAFIESTLQSSFGSAAGHFVACYVVEQAFGSEGLPVGRVIAVAHVGAAPIRDHLNKSGFYLRLAEQAIESGVSTAEDTADGLFAVDMATDDGQALIAAAMAARNFGYANRQLVADRMTEVVHRWFRDNLVAEPHQIRHVDHVAFEAVDGKVRSRRGLQPMHPNRLVFITGGEYAHGYLAAEGGNAAAADHLCCHGSPVRDTNEIPSYIWENSQVAVDPGEASRWATTMAANTDLEARKFWSDLSNLEMVMAYLRRSDIARPVARLRPLMNYREDGL
jgi:hypothetical protein